jgi:hypothetical protein
VAGREIRVGAPDQFPVFGDETTDFLAECFGSFRELHCVKIQHSKD